MDHKNIIVDQYFYEFLAFKKLLLVNRRSYGHNSYIILKRIDDKIFPNFLRIFETIVPHWTIKNFIVHQYFYEFLVFKKLLLLN